MSCTHSRSALPTATVGDLQSFSGLARAAAEHQVPDFRVKDGCNFSTSGPWTAANCSTDVVDRGTEQQKIWLDL